jgi:predicted nuclease of restriction endonuclease-like (RecB) superfamily
MSKVTTQNTPYEGLLQEIGQALHTARQQAAQAVNTLLVQTYWHIGQHIVEFEQGGKEKAEYGSGLLDRLAKDLSALYGKGFSRSNVFYMRKLYLSFQNSETLSHKLTWSHYFEILKADEPLEISFYTRQAALESWSVRELKRQMKSMLFHRLALSKDKESVLQLAQQGHDVQHPEDLLKEPFVLEFLNIPQSHTLTETQLEQKIIDHLQHFILELGKGFAFIARQYRMSIGGKHFYADLLFYHRILKCFVVIDLKRGEINHQDIGQMNLYLNYFAKEENVEGDNQPVGIILGAYKDHFLVEYATASITNQILLAKYLLHLPDKALLGRQLERLFLEDGGQEADGGVAL